jgi:hypothetical protein
MIRMTNEVAVTDRDARTGQFKLGHTGLGGRPKGARSKLSEAFLEDLRDAWSRHGNAVLDKCAAEHPDVFLRSICSLMPRDITLTATVDPSDIATKVRAAIQALGNDIIEPPTPPPPLRRTKLIEHGR